MKVIPLLRPRLLARLLVVLGVPLAVACARPAEPDPARGFRDEGEAALAEGNAERAVAAYLLAVAVSPGDVEALRGLLAARVAHGDGEDALATLGVLEEQSEEPVDPCPALALATDTRLAAGRWEPAEVVARRAVLEGCTGADASLAAVLTARGEADAGAGEVAAALDHYREAIALAPDDAGTYRAAATLLLEEGRVLESIRLLANALERHPEDRALRDLMVRAMSIP